METTKEEENVVYYALPDGFAPEDLETEAYAQPMRDAFSVITEEQDYLCARAKAADFDPVRELDYTANGCGPSIDALFETGGRYAEGRVPSGGLGPMMTSFHNMMAALAARKDAPLIELDAAGVAFRESVMPLRKRCAVPEKPRRIYLRDFFGGRDVFKGKLKLLHEAYVRAKVAASGRDDCRPPRRKVCRVTLTPEQRAKRDDRRRVLVEIGRLCKLGYSAPGAIRHMRKIDTWKCRMGTQKNATWLRYYRG